MDPQNPNQGTSPRGGGNPGQPGGGSGGSRPADPSAPQGPNQGQPQQQTPDVQAHHEPVPITITRWDFSGDTPQRVTETRHMIYNNWAYRKVCEELGIDVGKMQQEARKKQREASEEEGEPEMDAGEVQDLLDVDTNDMEAMSTLIWGSLITEDPSLTVEQVEQWLTVQNLEGYGVKVIRALSFWLNGHADFDNEAVAEEIAANEEESAEAGKGTGGAAK